MTSINWHTKKMNDLKTKSMDSLDFIRDDALEAAKTGDGWNPKAGQYWDEYHYACMEINSRKKLAA
jgi:hypothetical protein